ncbi:MAG: low molecular weight phosphotyrosine protein phosphatase [Rhodothermales bacterium]|nr:low molecular weight phosphotyrosine protein phosphatase [Rhodothermales bacterium]
MREIRDVNSILFVCLGNICRSPLAEGVFRHRLGQEAPERQMIIDSAGTGDWHVGEPPDQRMRNTSLENGVSIDNLRARQFSRADFDDYDLILAMDRNNLRDILSQSSKKSARQKVMLFRNWEPGQPDSLDVPDPYFGGQQGFDEVFDIVDRTVQRLVAELTGS